jgi:shikimate 5-dehydrogenase
VADVVFVGVTTGSSLARQALACWQPLLGLRCGLRGIDVALDADDSAYVDLLDGLRRDRSVLGAVITVHKLRMFEVGRSRFDGLDRLALACEEVNAIRRHRDGALQGWARDPVSVGRVVDRIWPRSDGDVICLGAGGTAVALAHHLFATRPGVRFECADRAADAVGRVARIAGQPVRAHVGSGPWDHLMAHAPDGSLVVNATGMGKDRPGSPITEQVSFPRSSVVWELNYRGDLGFLRQARRQAEPRLLDVHDGWELFCHGWAAALSVVLDLPDDPELGHRFVDAARHLRPAPT